MERTVVGAVFVAGIAVAVIGIGWLLVDFAVGGIIATLTSGLWLLKMRADRLGRMG
jgi:hypothetical protein